MSSFLRTRRSISGSIATAAWDCAWAVSVSPFSAREISFSSFSPIASGGESGVAASVSAERCREKMRILWCSVAMRRLQNYELKKKQSQGSTTQRRTAYKLPKPSAPKLSSLIGARIGAFWWH